MSCPSAPTTCSAASPSSGTIFDLPTKRTALASLDARLAAPDLWDDPARAGTLSQEASRLRDQLERWERLEGRAADAVELAGLLDGDPDPGMVEEVVRELSALEAEAGRRELDLLFTDPHSDDAALLTISAGAGGTDSQDWAEMLLRMYVRWAERNGHGAELLDQSAGEEAGIRSATLRITGERAFGLLRSERGVHRLVRLSPFDSAHRRHTSFALVEVVPEIEDDVTVEIDDKDVRTDYYRSSGAGGQHVNKTSSAVRLTHTPTGVVVTCQNERSQQQNRETAWRVLRSRLVALQQAAHAEHLAELKGESLAAEWGSQIRSYVIHPYTMVKDHRTGVEVGNAQSVLDGDLDALIEGYLRWNARREQGVAASA